MPTLGMEIDISSLVEAVVAGDREQIISTARSYLQQGAPAAELAGRIGLRVARGDGDGHAILTLNAAAALSRFISALPQLEGPGEWIHVAELPLLIQALVASAPALRAGETSHVTYPEPLYPSGLPEGTTVDEAMHTAVYNNDVTSAERLLFGLYGTGADYRTMEVRTYDSIATTFQHAGHPLICAVRGFQLLDVVEWGERAPAILHWLAPHLPLHTEEPTWINDVRAFLADPAHRVDSLRTRLAAPKDEHALPLRQLILSNASASQICQGVFDALMQGGSSTRGVGSVIALAAADITQMVGDADREAFSRAAHGLLFAAAVRMVYERVQDIAAIPLLFTSAAYVNSLQKTLAQEQSASPHPALPSTSGGGLIAPALLQSLQAQLEAGDLQGALATARRYTRFESDPRALWATIGLSAARADAAADQGHTLQIVQASAEEYRAWPSALAQDVDIFLQVALRAAAFGAHDTLVEGL